jgi:hypothetical protein
MAMNHKTEEPRKRKNCRAELLRWERRPTAKSNKQPKLFERCGGVNVGGMFGSEARISWELSRA